LKQQITNETILSILERKQLLSELARKKGKETIQAIGELNKMEHVYEPEGTVNNDNRVINVIVANEKSKELAQRLIDGERTD